MGLRSLVAGMTLVGVLFVPNIAKPDSAESFCDPFFMTSESNELKTKSLGKNGEFKYSWVELEEEKKDKGTRYVHHVFFPEIPAKVTTETYVPNSIFGNPKAIVRVDYGNDGDLDITYSASPGFRRKTTLLYSYFRRSGVFSDILDLTNFPETVRADHLRQEIQKRQWVDGREPSLDDINFHKDAVKRVRNRMCNPQYTDSYVASSSAH
ncbi:hypothetical protein GOV11_03075 [Candidatus Woesearchaeota archaeon]|nr:hypothetical protein [Candidatus Woesearchaeota archaeon]